MTECLNHWQVALKSQLNTEKGEGQDSSRIHNTGSSVFHSEQEEKLEFHLGFQDKEVYLLIFKSMKLFGYEIATLGHLGGSAS